MNIVSLGFAPNGDEMFSWEEEDGSQWEEYWESTPGGGMVVARRVVNPRSLVD